MGSFLYLRPEDVSTNPANGFYAVVSSVTRAKVTATADGGVGPLGRHAVPRSVAVLRVVPAEEVTGNHVSTWLRRGIACVDGPDVLFGQVVRTGEAAVQVNTVAGGRWVELEAVLSEVHPFTAMLLFEAQWRQVHWTKRVVSRVDDHLCTLLRGPAGDGPSVGNWDEAIRRLETAEAPTIPEVLAAMEVDLDVDGQVRRRWEEAETGELRVTTLEHAQQWRRRRWARQRGRGSGRGLSSTQQSATMATTMGRTTTKKRRRLLRRATICSRRQVRGQRAQRCGALESTRGRKRTWGDGGRPRGASGARWGFRDEHRRSRVDDGADGAGQGDAGVVPPPPVWCTVRSGCAGSGWCAASAQPTRVQPYGGASGDPGHHHARRPPRYVPFHIRATLALLTARDLQ